MDIIQSIPYETMQSLFKTHFHLPNLGTDASEKLALICLICNVTEAMKQKKPDVTHWSVLYLLNQKGQCGVREDWLKGLAVICSEIAYGCTTFPNFGMETKDMPKKIIEMLRKWLPF